MSKPLTPATPIHPDPDTEVSLPDEGFPVDELDLNPDLDEDEEETPTIAPKQEAEIEHPEIKTDFSHLENYSYQLPSEPNFFLWTLPFHQAMDELVAKVGSRLNHEHLNMQQESKLVTFLDDKLLQVQRKFIKNQADTDEKYPLQELLNDIKSIVDLIWCLIDLNTPLFGQEEYFIRILGDLEDWIAYYDIPMLEANNANTIETHKALFKFFQSLDTRVSFLIDGYYINNTHYKLSATELVRLGPIVNRVRIEIINKMERSRAQLVRQSQNVDSNSATYMNILEIEVGRLLEGIIERI